MNLLTAEFGTGVPLWDIVLQAVLLLLVLWLALRNPDTDLQRRLDRHTEKLNALRDNVADIQALLAPYRRDAKAAQKRKDPPLESRADALPLRPEKPLAPQTPVRPQTHPQASPAVVREAEVVSAPIVLYAKLPEREGFFKVGNLSEGLTGESLFQLVLETPLQARVVLQASADRFQTALQAPHIYLDPGCHYERQPGLEATSVQTLVPGKAVLEDGRWRVTQKLQVEFH